MNTQNTSKKELSSDVLALIAQYFGETSYNVQWGYSPKTCFKGWHVTVFSTLKKVLPLGQTENEIREWIRRNSI